MKIFTLRRTLFVCLIMATGPVTIGQNVEQATPERCILFERFSTGYGLDAHRRHAIHQDQPGFLRVGTANGLKPGRYTFRVIARSSYGGGSRNNATLGIKNLSPWWFRLTAIVLSLGLLFVFFRWRIRDYRQRNEALEVEVAHWMAAEQALKLRDAQYQSFIQNSSEAIWCMEFDPPLPLDLSEDEQVEHMYRHVHLVEANAYYADFVGMDSPQEMIGMSVQDIMPREIPENEQAVRDMIRSRFTIKEMISREPDVAGNIRIASNNMLPMIEDGNVSRVWGTGRDITGQETARERLAVAEEKYRSVVEHANEAIMVIGGQTANYCNPMAIEMFGYSAEEMLRSPWIQFIHPEDRPQVEAESGKRLSGTEPDARYTIRVLTKNNGDKWVVVNSTRIQWEGRPATLVMLTDITLQVQAEHEVNEQRDTLARVDRTDSMGQLAGAIAHELNQPLTGILSNAQAGELLMEVDPIDEAELKTIFGEVVSDAKRAGEIIYNLRELYRNQEVRFDPLNVNAMIEDTLRLMRGEFTLKNIQVELEMADEEMLVLGNRVQIQQVLVNLILNAHDAMEEMDPADRHLVFRTRKEADSVEVQVLDQGTGIDPDIMDKIFEPLATWKSGGTGMGLAISASIIDANGGSMTAANRPEGGACMSFTLPEYVAP